MARKNQTVPFLCRKGIHYKVVVFDDIRIIDNQGTKKVDMIEIPKRCVRCHKICIDVIDGTVV